MAAGRAMRGAMEWRTATTLRDALARVKDDGS